MKFIKVKKSIVKDSIVDNKVHDTNGDLIGTVVGEESTFYIISVDNNYNIIDIPHTILDSAEDKKASKDEFKALARDTVVKCLIGENYVPRHFYRVHQGLIVVYAYGQSSQTSQDIFEYYDVSAVRIPGRNNMTAVGVL